MAMAEKEKRRNYPPLGFMVSTKYVVQRVVSCWRFTAQEKVAMTKTKKSLVKQVVTATFTILRGVMEEAYLNMARHNVFLIINHLTDRFKYLGFEKINDDEDIIKKNILLNIFDTTNKKYDDEREKVYNYLIKRHNLPLLKIFNQELLKDEDKIKETTIDFNKLHHFINVSFKELYNLRNAYSHNLAIDDKGNELKRKKDIDNSIKKDIELLFEYAPSFSFIRNQQTQKE